ncbi:Hypothetical predicted protein [Olea europaea subsp. europaea]|uniref:BZIP domain-containing protein n=1 Tax=Olea europaea subsp. europaea TaxID=158383 RepID=A0A8S0UBH2_OLEEU|nr:Hypothetical predicted protein [Olea europaea subsp. europaea]
MSEDEEWVKTAMIDDLMVVELLVRLNQSQHPPPPPSGEIKQLKWSVRQRRSRPATVKPATRASPTTPLSWSGGATSLSGGSGGRDESSHSPPKLAHHERSKINNSSEKSAIKRSRKKKNLTELKEEVDLLSKERRELKRVLFLILLRVLININLQILLPMKWHQNNYFYTGNISFTSQSGETKGY